MKSNEKEKKRKKMSVFTFIYFFVERDQIERIPIMSSLGLVADRWRTVTTDTGDISLLGSGGHAEVYLVEDMGRSKKDDDKASAGDITGRGDGNYGDGGKKPRPRRGDKTKRKRYALKIDKRVSAGCVGTVRHETKVIRSLEGVPGVVRLAPELEEEEEEDDGDDEEEARDGDDDGDEGQQRKRRKRKRSTVSGTLRDGRSWVVMELLGRNLAEASVAAGALAPRRRSRRSSRRAAAAEEEQAKGGGDENGRNGGDKSKGGEEEEKEPETCWRAEDVRTAASSMLSSLAAMHAAGWIHRDVKPANFVLSLPEDDDDDEEEDDDGDENGTKKRPRNSEGDEGNKASRSSNPARRWVAIDFGLSTRFLDASGAVLPPKPPEKRRSVGASSFPSVAAAAASEGSGGAGILFRGSTTYASPAAHSGRDASRRDDLWSWIYSVSELVVGTLPWREYDDSSSQKNRYSSFEEAKTVARERACAGKRAVAADPGALMGSIGSAEGCFSQPKTPGVVAVGIGGGGGSEPRQPPTLSLGPAAAAAAAAACPPALARAARHVASLGFRDAPDYALLAQCAAELPGPMRRRTRSGREKRAKRAAEAAEEDKRDGGCGGRSKGKRVE